MASEKDRINQEIVNSALDRAGASETAKIVANAGKPYIPSMTSKASGQAATQSKTGQTAASETPAATTSTNTTASKTTGGGYSFYPTPGTTQNTPNYSGWTQAASDKYQPSTAAMNQLYGNFYGALTGDTSGNNFDRMTTWTMPTDYGTIAKTAIATGGNPYQAQAANTLANQKSAINPDYRQYYGQNDDAVNAYYNENKFSYDDPYGFMSSALALQPDINNALAAYTGNSYANYAASPEYQSLADQYMRQGQLAMENTLGTQAATTGGLGSSAAVAAAQQAYNQYMGNLEDAAQTAYQNQLANQQSQLSALTDLQNTYLGAYGDDYARQEGTYNTDQDRQYDWYKLLTDYQKQDQDFMYGMFYDPWAMKQTVDAGNASNQYSYDQMAQDQSQFDTEMAENQRQFDATTKDNYYNTDAQTQRSAASDAMDYAIAQLDSATDIQKAQISAASGGSSGSSATSVATAYKGLADEALKNYDYESYDKYMALADAALASIGQ